ncbi:hypothetical protein NMY22_g18178 [Coprinellus aureogranulatus]|nr:hypothetical protein NMY22_g18178 [Coprinellus aureogranulatus]
MGLLCPNVPPPVTYQWFTAFVSSIAGIAMAIRLKRDAGFDNFTIYERAGSVGGTWRGCGCDIAGHWYSLSTDLNPHWKTRYPTQPEIYEYWNSLWRKYNLDRHTKLNTEVSFARWDASKQMYEISLQGRDGMKSRVEANIVVYATGGFYGPKYPPGLELDKFQGDAFHAARWNHEVDLKGKTVGVIGNGCSAAQFVPEIAKDPSVKVVNFARTPQWYLPQANHSYPPLVRWIFANIPGVMRAYRNWLLVRSDMVWPLFHNKRGSIVKSARKRFTKYIEEHAPREYIKDLIPSYAPGCKRLILDPGYLASLHQPNVSLRFDPLQSIVEDGIKLRSGETVPVDVVIFGTGYNLYPVELKAQGSRGTTLADYWKSKEGPQAYLGTCYPGFPNLYTLLGPNVATGHASVVFSQEAQIQLILQLIKPVLDGTVQSFEVTDEATDKYNDWLQKRIGNSVWSECRSFYNEVDGKKAKNTATFPGPVTLFWWFCRTPQWEVFRAVGGEAWEKRQSLARYKRWSLWTLLLAAAVGLVSAAPALSDPRQPKDKYRIFEYSRDQLNLFGRSLFAKLEASITGCKARASVSSSGKARPEDLKKKTPKTTIEDVTDDEADFVRKPVEKTRELYEPRKNVRFQEAEAGGRPPLSTSRKCKLGTSSLPRLLLPLSARFKSALLLPDAIASLLRSSMKINSSLDPQLRSASLLSANRRRTWMDVWSFRPSPRSPAGQPLVPISF